jgi:preprotein translocase subunit SecG
MADAESSNTASVIEKNLKYLFMLFFICIIFLFNGRRNAGKMLWRGR